MRSFSTPSSFPLLHHTIFYLFDFFSSSSERVILLFLDGGRFFLSLLSGFKHGYVVK